MLKYPNMWIKREISEYLLSLAEKRPSILLTGARQTGKTSLIKKLFINADYVALDLPNRAKEASLSGESFLGKFNKEVIIDEIQYAPGLFPYLKVSIDEKRDWMGRYLLTGSQKFSLMENVSESLAGRVSVMELHSLSAKEWENHSQKRLDDDDLINWMYKGGYPEIYERNLDIEEFYASYLTTYLERDVRKIINVKDLADFEKFMKLLALRTGQLLNMNSIASEVGVSSTTIKRWVSILEASNIIILLPPYFKNLGKRLVKTPKIYFLDTGLACYLAGFTNSEELFNSSLLGSFFETHCFGQLYRSFCNKGKRPNIYFYRDQWGREVDFVIPVGEKLKLYECKWSENPDTRIIGFKELETLIGKKNILSKNLEKVKNTFYFLNLLPHFKHFHTPAHSFCM